ncbi:MAG TPA: HAD family hydrolase, partial [Candidatus Binatia bacterium]
RAVHQNHGTSEYAFLIQEIPSLRKYQSEDLLTIFNDALKAYRVQRRRELKLYPTVAESLLKLKGAGTKIVGYTESMAYYSNYRVRKLGLDGVFDILFSPADHDIPKDMTIEQIRKYPASRYEFQNTVHQYTPTGELKPNRDILLSIIRHIDAAPEDCVYVGDSLFKDVAMAKDAGISDAWAKYGQSQATAAYQLLREVTHWSDDDVEREKKISQRDVKPSIELSTSFSDIFSHFKFGNIEEKSFHEISIENKLSTEEKKTVIDVWKTIVDVQKHFNDISIRIRGLFITLVLAHFAALGFLADKDLKYTIGAITIHYSTLVPLAGIVGSLLFYFMDRYWYHRLLYGSVRQGFFIENRHRFEIPEIRLTDAIGAESPIKLERVITKWLANRFVTDKTYKSSGLVHSNGKIELFYKPVVVLFILMFLGIGLAGGIRFDDKSIIQLMTDALVKPKPKEAILPHPSPSTPP